MRNRHKSHTMHRRELLKLGGAAALGAALVGLAGPQRSRAQPRPKSMPPDRKFLFVIAAGGGASIVDSLLPQLSGPTAFAQAQVEQPTGSNFRCPVPLNNQIQGVIPLGDGFRMSSFLAKHAEDTVVMTQEVTSVNHAVASRRAVTGNGAFAGRTLQEAAAVRHGMDLLLPNCSMAGDDYGGPSIDPTVPAKARSEVISDPRYFGLSTNGHRAMQGAPEAAAVTRARAVRARLEQLSARTAAMSAHPQVKRYLDNRAQLGPSLESANLISKLMLAEGSARGLEDNPDYRQLAQLLPNLSSDPLEAQTALAFLLAKHGVSSSVTLGVSGTPIFDEDRTALTSPLAFDWSHVDLRGAQNAMWSRIFHMTDVLVDLLKQTEYADGSSMWDRSLVYIATEFGRDKVSSGGAGHHLNNGTVLISPLLRGNRVYGGVDGATGLTYGFDPRTGEPDSGRKMREQDVFGAICQALDVSFPDRHDFPCMVKSA